MIFQIFFSYIFFSTITLRILTCLIIIIFLQICHKNGNRTIVKSSYQTTADNQWMSYLNYVWSGYVIECPKHGEIYRSRQHWFGNKDPEDSAVRMEISHVWPGVSLDLFF